MNETNASRFIIGIDLGTTNSSLAYVDTAAEVAVGETPEIRVMAVPQLVAPGEAGDRDLLPSFLYAPPDHESPADGIDRPWAKDRTHVLGELARSRGADLPDRLISSAKSWLCHGAVDRHAEILPWGADAAVPRISPVLAQTFILEHLRDAWNEQMAAADKALRLENQGVLITVPASFDAVARELTVDAARQAGIVDLTLLEEPLAAFYAWLSTRGEAWRQDIGDGDEVLVCDVGGGTTDLTMVKVGQSDGDLSLERTAVGDHLLLGGDNMDLALAILASQRLASEKGSNLDPWQTRSLWHACRAAKERILSSPKKTKETVAVLGRGSKLVGKTVKTEITRDDIEQVLIEGFFPECRLEDRPQQARRAGLSDVGLPFAADPGVTRHIARFLASTPEGNLPTALLVNGGVFRAGMLRERLGGIIDGWKSTTAESAPVKILEGNDLELAVARGATAYGLVRRGRGLRIRGGTTRTYYIGVESAMPAVPGLEPPVRAVCVAPFGMEEGTSAELPSREFRLRVGEPAEFRFFGSSQRRSDKPGDEVGHWEEGELEELAPLKTTLEGDQPDTDSPAGTAVTVGLRASVTEVGTLELWCQERESERSWKLEWNVREPIEES